ncbi:22386_t:CDS:1, partial [Racocetra persica]
KRVKLSHLAKKTKMNDVRVKDSDSENIYNKFFRIYNPRRVFIVEFFAQRIESDFNDQST